MQHANETSSSVTLEPWNDEMYAFTERFEHVKTFKKENALWI